MVPASTSFSGLPIFCAYFVHILRIFCAYFAHTLCIFCAYFAHILCNFYEYFALICAYFAHILCIFCAYFGLYSHYISPLEGSADDQRYLPLTIRGDNGTCNWTSGMRADIVLPPSAFLGAVLAPHSGHYWLYAYPSPLSPPTGLVNQQRPGR